ncbi:MAG: hypothetical protein HETSPECPRED_003916 [Heterodermia speciosa]|uniref:Protein RER1 n=1 Tax=Heterodermia speciosa TaxID=116794 RepID=A0A8H3F6D5_9LECA|nr:MAG: hypothetical protein HETSPECPRED_003916 [Heterodermia speciosa]
MDSQEPDQTPFAAVSAQTSRFTRLYQSYLDKSTPFTAYRWSATGAFLIIFFLRIVIAQGWYIGTFSLPLFLSSSLQKVPPLNSSIKVCYTLGIYLLNQFLAFLQPKFDPSLSQDEGIEDGESALPTKQDEEFRPFIRRLPEFKFWHSSTRAILLGFAATWFEVFNVPVFWPVLVVYFIILFSLTMRRQIQHMIKYRYVPFTFGKTRYNQRSGH